MVARDVGAGWGWPAPDAELVAAAVRHHLLLPQTATRRDLDDPVTVAQVAAAVGSRALLELLHALADRGRPGDRARRLERLEGGPGRATWCGGCGSCWPASRRRGPLPLRAGPAGAGRTRAARPRPVAGAEVTVVAPGPARACCGRRRACWPRTGWRCGRRQRDLGGGTAVTVFTVAPEFGDPPDAHLVTQRPAPGAATAGWTSRSGWTAGRARAAAPRSRCAPPKVTLVDDASDTATVVEVRAHDAPGLLWRIGRALGDCGLDVRAARVETLGAEAVDVFYVVDGEGSRGRR